MGHEIRKTDNFAEVRSNGQRAWHGLGIEIPEGLSAVDAFKRTGLDWQTELLPLTAERLTTNGFESVAVKTHKLQVRCDTGGQLGVVAHDYPVVQNMDLAEFADTMLGADRASSVETCGSLYDGRRVFVLVKLPGGFEVAPGDEIRRFALVSNGHGGKASFNVYPTDIRVVCDNTIVQSEIDLSAGFRLMHRGDMKAKLKVANMAFQYALTKTGEFCEIAKALVGKRIDGATVKQFMLDAFDIAFPAPGEKATDLAKQKWQAKREKTFEAWRALFVNERNAMPSIRGTLWQAFNTVTEWHDHVRGRAAGDSESRLNSNLFGASHAAKTKTLKLALALV